MICTVNDIDYVVELHGGSGSASALLMLHGFMGSGACFGHITAGLSDFCRPVTLDLLGHGQTGGPNSPDRYHTDRQLNDLRRLVARLGVTPLYLHGYSMGGRLALQYALEYPETLRGVILESAHPGIEDPPKRKARRDEDESRAHAIETDFPGFLDMWEELDLFASPSPESKRKQPGDSEAAAGPFGTSGKIPDDRFSRYREIQRGQSPGLMAASLRGFGTGTMPSAWDRLKELQLPVLVIAGAGDRKYSELSGRLNALIPRNRVEIVPGAAHRVHLDQPYHFLKTVKSFLTNSQRHEH